MPKYKTANECYDLYMAEGGYILVKLKCILQQNQAREGLFSFLD